VVAAEVPVLVEMQSLPRDRHGRLFDGGR
jgi:hypothetical protein